MDHKIKITYFYIEMMIKNCYYVNVPIPVAVSFTVWVCGRSLARIVGSNTFLLRILSPCFFCTNLMGLTNFVPGIKIKVKVSLQQAMKAQRGE